LTEIDKDGKLRKVKRKAKAPEPVAKPPPGPETKGGRAPMACNPIIREHLPEISAPTDETVETNYASLERLECPWCFGGYLTISVEEDGQEHDEAVRCRRCNAESH
jgi:hypothetical protein